MTIGDVVLLRLDDERLAAAPRLLDARGPARGQYACWLGPIGFLPAYWHGVGLVLVAHRRLRRCATRSSAAPAWSTAATSRGPGRPAPRARSGGGGVRAEDDRDARRRRWRADFLILPKPSVVDERLAPSPSGSTCRSRRASSSRPRWLESPVSADRPAVVLELSSETFFARPRLLDRVQHLRARSSCRLAPRRPARWPTPAGADAEADGGRRPDRGGRRRRRRGADGRAVR